MHLCAKCLQGQSHAFAFASLTFFLYRFACEADIFLSGSD